MTAISAESAAEAAAPRGSGDEFDAGAAAIAPDYAVPIAEWLSGSAAAWTEVLAALTPAERAATVATMRAYEAALEKHASQYRPVSG